MNTKINIESSDLKQTESAFLNAKEKISILRDPLIHFSLLGLILYLVISVFIPEEESPNQPIVIDQSLKQELGSEFFNQRGREPTASELSRLIDQWLVNELLYKKGLALGVDRNDPEIRRRVVTKTEALLRKMSAINAPAETDLRSWYEQNQQQYTPATRYSFNVINLPKNTTAPQVQTLLRELPTMTPDQLRAQDYRNYNRRTTNALSVTFGKPLLETLETMPFNNWQAIETKKGRQLIKLNMREEYPVKDFKEAYPLVKRDWTLHQQNLAFKERMQQLRAEFSVIQEDVK